MMLEAFWRSLKFLQHLDTKDNEKTLCQDLLTIENTYSDLKIHVLHSANELLYVAASDFLFKNFSKVARRKQKQ